MQRNDPRGVTIFTMHMSALTPLHSLCMWTTSSSLVAIVNLLLNSKHIFTTISAPMILVLYNATLESSSSGIQPAFECTKLPTPSPYSSNSAWRIALPHRPLSLKALYSRRTLLLPLLMLLSTGCWWVSLCSSLRLVQTFPTPLVVSRFMHNPQEAHLQAAKHILRYVRRHPDLGLLFQQGEDSGLNGYTDADYGHDIDDRVSVGAYIFFLVSSQISWNSKKQSSTSRSSCESEYRDLAQCTCEAVWIRRLLKELRVLSDKPTNIYCDNLSSIKLSYNPVLHEKSKHFEIDYHFTRQKVENNTVKVEFISS